MLGLPLTVALCLSAAPAADSVSFRFAWPDGLSADVEYGRSRERAGRPSSVLKLRGRFVSEVRGDEVRFGFRGWRNVGPNAGEESIDPLLDAAGRITTVVTRAGAYVRVEGIEGAVEAVRAKTRGAPVEARPILERLEKMAPALLAKEASEFWSGLVQFWEGNDLTVGDDYQSDSRAPVAALPGESVRLLTHVLVKRRLPCPGGGGQCVEAWMRSQVDADDIERVMRRLISELGFPASQVTAMLGEMAGSAEVTLVTEPARLVPHRLTRTRAVRVAPAVDAPKDAKPVEGRDEATWSFRYSTVPAR